MALTDDEFKSLKARCSQLSNGPDYRCHDYVENLLNTALDFQMKSSLADKAIRYFKGTHGSKTHKEVKALLSRYPNTKDGNCELAKFLWNNKHWSRAQLLRKIVEFFEESGVTDQDALDQWANNVDFVKDVKGRIKTDQHSIAYTLFQWLRVRCGANTVKPDLRVLTFISRTIGRKVTPRDAVDVLERIAQELNRRANQLDSAIWHEMETQQSSIAD